MLESLFDKLQANTGVNIPKFLRAPILKNICDWLLLKVLYPFHATGVFLYPLKTSVNQRFS